MLSVLWEYPFMLSAWIAGLIAASIGGAVGSLIVVRRIAFMSGGIAHAVLGGIGLALWIDRSYWWCPPIVGALIVAIIAAMLIARAPRLWATEDSLIAAIWACGMALGIILISKTPGYTAELSSILTGNILWVTELHILLLSLLACITALFLFFRFQHIKLVIFDTDEALLQGIRVQRVYTQLLLLVAISVVALLHIVGIILVMCMLTLPQLAARLFTERLCSMMIGSMLLSMASVSIGLLLAYHCDWPAGASIALVATGIYFISVGIKKLQLIP